jgi:glucosamine--fructose-6-phosphate aminotransferase (isomerizing)
LKACAASNTAATTPPASPSPEAPPRPRTPPRPRQAPQPRSRPREHPVHGTFGIGHTRWATHGRPTEENAHPHRDGSGTLVVVHNGIVENYLTLKRPHRQGPQVRLRDRHRNHRPPHPGRARSGAPASRRHPPRPKPTTAADSPKPSSRPAPPQPHPLEEAVRRAVKRLTGAFAIGVLSAHEPDKIVAARIGPPAVIGIGEGEFFLASDVPGILHHTRNIYFLADGESPSSPRRRHPHRLRRQPHPARPQRITWDPIQAEKAGYKHFMLKEINEQPRAIRDTTLGRVSLDTGKVFLPNEDPRRLPPPPASPSPPAAPAGTPASPASS